MRRATRRTALFSIVAIAAPALISRSARAQPPTDWRLSSQGLDWPDFGAKFAGLGVAGTLVMQDANRGGMIVVNGARAGQGFLPGSTFDIPNTLVALQSGAAKDIDEEKFASPGSPILVDGKPFLPKACEADVTLRAAFQNSCIPVYQELARRIGADAYREWLMKFDYGDANIGDSLDSFWLDGALRISAIQQVKFLRRLVTKTLGASPRAIALTEEAMLVEKSGDVAIQGKSGGVYSQSPAIGWWVGLAQRGEDVVLLALNIDMPKPELAPALYRLAKEAFAAVGLE